MRHRRSRRVGYDGSLRGIDWIHDWEYLPSRAQLRAENAANRKQQTKLTANPRLAEEIQSRLDREDSPEQIAHRLRIDFPDEEEMRVRSEEHTSELQSLMRISYAVFCLKKKQSNTTS